jgi:hypothetical protein
MRCIAFATLGSLVVFEASAQVPTVNIARTCEIAATTLIGLNTAERDRELCLSAEQSALDQLKKDWPTYSFQDRSQCVQPKVYLPSYVEWLTCLEMVRDVRKMNVQRIDPRGVATLPKTSLGANW